MIVFVILNEMYSVIGIFPTKESAIESRLSRDWIIVEVPYGKLFSSLGAYMSHHPTPAYTPPRSAQSTPPRVASVKPLRQDSDLKEHFFQ